MRAAAALAIVLLLSLEGARPAGAKDQAKADCKQACRETLQSCKQDCQVERDSGTSQESDRYRNCDQACHDDYGGCVQTCEVTD